MLKTKWFLVVALMGLVALLLAACGEKATPTATPKPPAPTPTTTTVQATPTPTAVPKPTGQVTLAAATLAPGQLDPHKITSGTQVVWSQGMFDGLTRYNEKGELAPNLAEKWTILDNGLRLRFKLREGAKFQDGTEVTAEDVKWSFDRVVRTTSVRSGEIKGYMDRVEVVDRYTVDVYLTSPAQALLERMENYMAIVPKHLYEGKEDDVSKTPVGSGPWKMVQYEKPDLYKVEAFEEHFSRVPKVKTMNYRNIVEPATRWAAFRAGEVDIVEITGTPFVKEAKGIADVRLKPSLRTWVYFVQYNALWHKNIPSPLQDVRVRKALIYAVDRQGIMDFYLGGYGALAPYYLMPHTNGYSSDDPVLPYDLEKAKALLKEAGYAAGFDLTYEYIAIHGPWPEAIADALSKVGVKVKLELMEVGAFASKLGEKKMLGLASGGQMGPMLWEAYGGNIHFGTKGAYSYYPNEEITNLLDKSARTYDRQERYNLARQVAKIFLEDYPVMPLFYGDTVWALGPKVGDWTMIPGSPMVLNTETVTLKK